MGKLIMSADDPKHHHQYSKTLKVMPHNKSVKKTVKVTYISSPLLVRACDASEFRTIVQQLTGKDSNHFNIHGENHHHQDPPITCSNVMQGGNPLAVATTAAEDGNASPYYYYDRSMDSLEFDEDYFWKEVACSVQLSSYALA